MDTQVYVLTKHTEGCTKVLGVFVNKDVAKSIAMDAAKAIAKGYLSKDVHFYEWDDSSDGHYRLEIAVDFDDGDEMDVDFDVTKCAIGG